VLKQDLDLAQASVDQVAGKRRNTSIPGAPLARASSDRRVVEHLLEYQLGYAAIASNSCQARSRAPDKRQGQPPRSAKDARVRAYPDPSASWA
jgi:hypothetical protein